MKKLAVIFAAAAVVVLTAASSASAGNEPTTPEPNACKPTGASCHNSFECCSQNCQTVNNKTTCH